MAQDFKAKITMFLPENKYAENDYNLIKNESPEKYNVALKKLWNGIDLMNKLLL